MPTSAWSSAATLADRGEPVGATLAWLAHTLGLACDRTAVDGAAELLDGFDPASLPRGDVTVTGPASV
jgi:hypothetical protein